MKRIVPKKPDPIKVHIRWMIRRDMEEVFAIEQASFSEPWQEEDFLLALRERNVIGMVAEMGEILTGYMVYELHKTKIHILNFAVCPKHRRREIGKQLCLKLTSKLCVDRRQRITMDIPESNLPGLMFWKSQGFLAIGVQREFFPEEDAIRMQYKIVGAEESVNRIWEYEES